RAQSFFLLIPILAVIVETGIQILPLRNGQTISLDPYRTRQALISWVVMAIFLFLLASTINTERRISLLFKILIIWGGFISLFAIVQSLTSNGRIFWWKEMSGAYPFGPFINRNHYAGFIEMLAPLPISMIFFGERSPIRRKCYLVSGAMMIVSL